MRKARHRWRDDKIWARFSLARAIFWVVIIPIAVLLGWVESVAFVSVISLYANLAGDVAAWRADDSQTMERIEKKLDELLRLSKEGRE